MSKQYIQHVLQKIEKLPPSKQAESLISQIWIRQGAVEGLKLLSKHF